jgi:hypothetical protein
VSTRFYPSVRTVALPLHAISIIRSEYPDDWTSFARLALSRIVSGREHTSSRWLQLSSHICVWDRNPITCRTLNGVRTVLPRHPDRCTWTLDSSQPLNSGRTICHYVRTDNLEQFKASRHRGTSGQKVLVFRTDDALTNERPDGISHRLDRCKGTKLTILNYAQSLLEAHNWSVYSE